MRDYCFVWVTLGYHGSIQINVKVKNEAVNDRVNLKVHTKSVDKSCQNILAFEDEKHGTKHEHGYDVVI